MTNDLEEEANQRYNIGLEQIRTLVTRQSETATYSQVFSLDECLQSRTTVPSIESTADITVLYVTGLWAESQLHTGHLWHFTTLIASIDNKNKDPGTALFNL
jgi:hypothetical protein